MSVESSRQRSISGTISCSERIACSTRASVEKPVLPRRLRERPSFSNRISPSCCGEAIRNSSSASAKISRFELRDLLAHALGDLGEALEVQRARRAAPSRAAPPPAAARSSRISALQAALGDLLALPVGERARAARASAATGSSRSLGDPALLAELRERVAATSRLEQVGAEQRVVHERRRDRPSAFASCATTAALAARRHDLLGPLAFPEQHLPFRRRGEPPSGGPSANSAPSGASVSRTTSASS